MRRAPANDRSSKRQFRKRAARTDKLNLSAPRRGGIRL